MTAWWAAVIAFIVVILPVVVLVLHVLLRPARQIKAYADDVAEQGALFGPYVGAAVEELAQTRALITELRPQIERYAQALKRRG
jgi:hypothetical protein